MVPSSYCEVHDNGEHVSRENWRRKGQLLKTIKVAIFLFAFLFSLFKAGTAETVVAGTDSDPGATSLPAGTSSAPQIDYTSPDAKWDGTGVSDDYWEIWCQQFPDLCGYQQPKDPDPPPAQPPEATPPTPKPPSSPPGDSGTDQPGAPEPPPPPPEKPQEPAHPQEPVQPPETRQPPAETGESHPHSTSEYDPWQDSFDTGDSPEDFATPPGDNLLPDDPDYPGVETPGVSDFFPEETEADLDAILGTVIGKNLESLVETILGIPADPQGLINGIIDVFTEMLGPSVRFPAALVRALSGSGSAVDDFPASYISTIRWPWQKLPTDYSRPSMSELNSAYELGYRYGYQMIKNSAPTGSVSTAAQSLQHKYQNKHLRDANREGFSTGMEDAKYELEAQPVIIPYLKEQLTDSYLDPRNFVDDLLP